MKSASKRIRWIFDTFYNQRAKERSALLIKYAHNLMSELDYDVDGYYIAEERIVKAVDSYFLDVIKYKEYHFNPNSDFNAEANEWTEYIHKIKKINDSKVASYTAKWLLKASPIYIKVKKDAPIKSDFLCHINEFFVLNCTLYSLLKYDYNLIDPEDYRDLFYDFKYRNLDERAYFSRFELLEKVVALKKMANFDDNRTKKSI